MRSRFGVKLICVISALLLLCVSFCVLVACNDTISFSDKIFIDDFSGTYTMSVDVKVRDLFIAPEPARSFVYKKGFDKLYEEIVDTHMCSAIKVNDKIVLDITDNGRIYSCLIYPEGGNRFVIHSMTYTFGAWTQYTQIFFPCYLLDKEINPLDGENAVYTYAYNIDTLASYYKERGYLATINGNELRVVCLLRYPATFDFENKAIAWSVIFEDEHSIRFANFSNDYEDLNL